MRYIVLIYDVPPRSIAPAHAAASAYRPSTWVSARSTWRSGLRSIRRRPFVRWIGAPILGVPSVYSGYSTMLSFWHGLGVSPSLWLYILAIVAGVASGLAVIARLRT